MSGDFHKNIEIVKKNLDRRTLLEGFAEEATELAQAALKLIRAEELNNNVTPVSVDEARDNLIEEIGDVHLYLTLLVLDDEKYEDIFPVSEQKSGKVGEKTGGRGQMRLIDADKAVEYAERAYYEWCLAMAGAEGQRQINRVYKMQELCKAVKRVVESMPTVELDKKEE